MPTRKKSSAPIESAHPSSERQGVSITTNDIPLLSFFVGGGLLDMGFEQAGFDIVWTNECDPAFIQGYEAGITSWRKANNCHKPARITCTSKIEHIKTSQIISQAFGTTRPRSFGVIGGPPCPDFSMAGNNHGPKGENGKLSDIFVRRISQLGPDFFVFENVPGLYIRHRDYFDKIRRKLQSAPRKYVCDWKLLNALEFGVPQDRKRLFIIGVTPELFEQHFHRKPLLGEGGWFPWPVPKYPEALSTYKWPAIHDRTGSPRRPESIPVELMAGTYLNGSNPPELYANANDQFYPYSEKFHQIREGDIFHKSFKRLHRWRYSPTAAYGNNEVHLHPWENRRLSVREVMRLQSVPDSYALPDDMSLSAKFKMIANGVPVKLAEFIAHSLKQFLTEASNDSN